MTAKIFFPAIFIIIIFSSCKKAEIDTDFKSAQDNANAENLFMDIPMQIIPVINGYSPIAGYAMQNPGPASGNMQNFTCGNINILSTFDTVTNSYGFPFEFEINYGNGCTDAFDNKTRKGKITVSLDNYWDSVGTNISVSFSNYSVNNIALNGTITISYSDETHFNADVTDGECVFTSYTVQFNTSKTVFYQSGYATDTIIDDDVYKISGNSWGYDRSNRPYTTKTIIPFIKNASCGWITSGAFEITPEGLSTRTVDYGDNTCDKNASVVINGNTFDFELN
tara:strand:- start:16955 stop:17797 length:843 start_codon:yes stop_codon:yes gene_type:complete